MTQPTSELKWAPELAYSWPFLLLIAMFPFLTLWCFWSIEWARWTAAGLLAGCFACCPIRDALLNRFWPERP